MFPDELSVSSFPLTGSHSMTLKVTALGVQAKVSTARGFTLSWDLPALEVAVCRQPPFDPSNPWNGKAAHTTAHLNAVIFWWW